VSSGIVLGDGFLNGRFLRVCVPGVAQSVCPRGCRVLGDARQSVCPRGCLSSGVAARVCVPGMLFFFVAARSLGAFNLCVRRQKSHDPTQVFHVLPMHRQLYHQNKKLDLQENLGLKDQMLKKHI